MLTLAMDAATYDASVALLHGEELIGQRHLAMRGETEERLMPEVASLLDEAGRRPSDVGRIVCGGGPGSFTSLRIAASVAKGMAFATGAPLYAVSSLLLIAAGEERTRRGGRWLATLDAMRDERFVQAFDVMSDGRIVGVGRAMLVAVDRVGELAVSLGASRVGPGEETDAPPRASGVQRLLPQLASEPPISLDTWEPDYGRQAEAQRRWEAAHGRLLPDR